MIQTLTRIAFQEAKVYKVTVEIKEKNVPIYEKLHFQQDKKQMILYEENFLEKCLPKVTERKLLV